MTEEVRPCEYCKKDTKQIKQEWAMTVKIWQCTLCKFLLFVE